MSSIRSHAKGVYQRSRSWLSHTLDDSAVTFRNLVARDDARNRLLILDDIFPHMLSAFRIAEYNTYLESFPDVRICSTATAFRAISETRSFNQVLKEYESYYPQYRGKILKYTPRQDLRSSLVYTIFINNAFKFIEVAERYGTPFMFTLYPGGGFQLDQEASDRKLQRVFSSPMFRKVIVTQKISREYLLKHQLCDPNAIKFIFGGVLPSDRLARQVVSRTQYGQDKKTFDICFVANKYMPRGLDKGYDVFIEMAKVLSRMHSDIFFHVVGPFSKSDIDVTHIADRVKFYGVRHTDFFPEFYSRMDAILSPNAPFILAPGSFDGFPTGACVEAGLCGVAVFCTDILNQNIVFKNREEIVLISSDVTESCEVVDWYYRNNDALTKLSVRGQQVFRRVYDSSIQMKPRLVTLREFL